MREIDTDFHLGNIQHIIEHHKSDVFALDKFM